MGFYIAGQTATIQYDSVHFALQSISFALMRLGNALLGLPRVPNYDYRTYLTLMRMRRAALVRTSHRGQLPP